MDRKRKMRAINASFLTLTFISFDILGAEVAGWWWRLRKNEFFGVKQTTSIARTLILDFAVNILQEGVKYKTCIECTNVTNTIVVVFFDAFLSPTFNVWIS